VEALLAHGVDVNALSDVYGTPICLAAAKGRDNVFRILLNARANIHANAGGFGSLLHAACCSGDVEIVKALLERGFSVGLVRTFSDYVLDGMNVFRDAPFPSSETDYLRLASYTPLHVATIFDRRELISYLIDKGVKMNSISETWQVKTDPESLMKIEELGSRNGGRTALMLAAALGRCEVIQLLLQAGADPNANDDCGYTALHYAACSGILKCLEVLVQGNAMINAVDRVGFTPIAIATWYGHSDHVKYLAVHGADLEISTNESNWTPLILAALEGSTACLRILLERGASMERRDKDGYTALALAAWKGHADCIEYLASQGADIETQGEPSWTPLHVAACQGQLECLKVLIRFGASISNKEKRGCTALAIAARFGHTECIQYLASQGADFESLDEDGDTPLLIAAYFGSVADVKALIDLGANLRARNSKGRTALKVAEQRGHREIVEVLEEAMKR
jgi:cytohesin